jgi:hypothetical protein
MTGDSKVQEIPAIHPNFEENRRKFPPKELMEKYGGQHVAWNLEGTAILVSAPSEEEMEDRLITMGINPAHVVGSYVPRGDEAWYF